LQKLIVWLLIGYAEVRCLATWGMNDWVASPASLRLAVVGCMMVSVSILGRRWAIRSLGLFHSIHIEIRDHPALVSTGEYQFVRNPHCLSNISEAIGLPLLGGSRSALTTSLSVYLPPVVHRMIREEEALSRELGAPFARYKREVAMIVPMRLSVNKSAALNATFIEPSAEQTSKP
jgi:protein-S-isoprenylcysteine O-methyltransferase Ste14